MILNDYLVYVLAVAISMAVSGLIVSRIYERRLQRVRAQVSSNRQSAAEAERIMYKSFLDHTTDGIAIMDEDYNIRDVNSSFLEMFDYAEDELLGNPLYQYILTSEYTQDDVPNALIRMDHDQYETVRTRKNGMPVIVRIATFTVDLPTEEGMKTFICSQYTDVTEKRESEKKIRELAYYDTLTGLPNRYLLESKVSELLNTPEGRQFSFIFMDLNGFKHINDTLGHDFGDLLLVAFSKRIRGNIKKDDFLARVGGDEFILLLPDTPRSHASSVVERLHKLLGSPFLINKQRIYVGLAAGIAAFPDDAESAKEIYRFADIAMYTAKQNKLPYLYYDAKMRHEYQERMELEQQLIPALKREGEIVLHYLPVFDVEDNRIVSFEALCRWQHPQLGLLNSSRFIHIAEDSQLIYQLGSLVMSTAFSQADQWRREGFDFAVTVNLSAKEVLLEGTLKIIEQLIEQYPGIQECVELEITEAVSVLNIERGKAAVRKLKELGFKIILDDFGVGYSSLNLLRDLHIDRLKIDKFLIDDLEYANSTSLILKGLVHLAGMMDVDVVAEGVGTERQKQILIDIGFRYLQGFLLSEPLPASEVPKLAKIQQKIAVSV